MQHVSSFTAVPAAARKAAALSAYDAAVMAPTAADWQSVAHMLRASIPAGRALPAAAADTVPAWFADYALPKAFRKESILVTFTDGVTVRCGLHTALRKAPRIAAACRVAIDFYRCQTGRSSVPEMTSLRVVGSGVEFDPAECSRLTRDLRAVAPVATPWVPSPSPSWSDHTMETPVQRAERMFGGHWYLAADGNVMRSHEAPTFDPVEWEFPDEALSRTRKEWVAEWAQDDAQAWRDAWAEQHQADWCQAIADAYAEPVETEMPGTFEAGGAPMPVETIATADPVEAMPICPAVGEPCRAACPFRSGCGRPVPTDATPGEAIVAPCPVVEIAADAPEATACENAADLTTGQTVKTGADYSDPIPEGGVEIARSALETLGPQGVEVVLNTPCPAPSMTHTITAVCSSHRGRERLLAKVQDGCFPAARREYHGAFMITLQDAQEIGEIRGVRFVGMPRRPRSKAAEPVAVSNVVQMPERDNRPLAADLSEAA